MERNAPVTSRTKRSHFTGPSAGAPIRPLPLVSPPLRHRTLGKGHRSQERWKRTSAPSARYAYLKAREELMTGMLKARADHWLDASIHKAVEHQPTLIKDGVNPPFVDEKKMIA